MAENAAAAAVEDEQEPLQCDIKIEDVGVGSKKVTIEVPKDVVAKRLADQFKELREAATIPGFRKGHAPAGLVQKRFGKDVRAELRGTLIRESFERVVKENTLQILGEPVFDKPDDIRITDDAPFTYSFQVEVQPEFALPDISTLKVRKPVVEVTDKHIEQAMRNLREQQGQLVPVEGRGVEADDRLVTDIHVKLDGAEVAHQHEVQIVARPTRIWWIPVEDLAARLAGANADETRSITAKAPADHPTESVRDKDVQIDITIKEIKRLELAEIDQEFLDGLGFASEQELRDALKLEMIDRVASDVQRVVRGQVMAFLDQNTTVEVPAKLNEQQAQRVVARRAVDLMVRGMPKETVNANIEKLREGADAAATRELKMFFILQKVAADNEIDVSEDELNGRIAMIAAQRDIRPERLRQDMAADGSLQQLYISMRDERAIDLLLSMAQVEEVPGEVPAAPDAEPSEPAAQPLEDSSEQSSAT